MKRGILWVALLCIVLLASGCGKSEQKVVIGGSGSGLKPINKEEAQETEEEELPELYIFKGIIEDLPLMAFEKVGGENREVVFYYNGGTDIFDRFQLPISAEQMKPGEIYEMDIDVNTQTIEKLTQSSHVWVFPELTKYKVNVEQGSLTVGDEVYKLGKKVPVFDADEEFTREQIGADDELTVIGIGKDILSVMITTSHGELAFENIKGFEKGYFVLGNVAAARIVKNEPMSVRAGTYLLEVAGSGHSGAKEITIEPGKLTTVDLKEFNNGEIKKGKLTLVAKQKNVTVTLNGKKVDLEKAMMLPYGVYRIKATKKGCKDWTKILFLNSENATVTINMNDATATNENANNTKPTSGLAGSQAGSLAGSTTGTGGQGGNTGNTGNTTGNTGNSNNNNNSNNSTEASETSPVGTLANEVLKILTEDKQKEEEESGDSTK